jgi:hypothetical protein
MPSKDDGNKPTGGGEEDSGSSLLLNQPVVIDNGTSTLKAGFAGSSKPKVRCSISILPCFLSSLFFFEKSGRSVVQLLPEQQQL